MRIVNWELCKEKLLIGPIESDNNIKFQKNYSFEYCSEQQRTSFQSRHGRKQTKHISSMDWSFHAKTWENCIHIYPTPRSKPPSHPKTWENCIHIYPTPRRMVPQYRGTNFGGLSRPWWLDKTEEE